VWRSNTRRPCTTQSLIRHRDVDAVGGSRSAGPNLISQPDHGGRTSGAEQSCHETGDGFLMLAREALI
jgi:hypothetical protein